MIKILIVDDHNLIRTGLLRILDDVAEFSVVGGAKSGEEAISLSRELMPDVVLMDVKMPGIGGIEATKRLTALNHNLKVIAVTSCNDELYPSRLLEAGAVAYLTKRTHPDEIILAIRKVVAGDSYLSQEIAQQLAMKSTGTGNYAGSPFEQLSERELQIAMMTIRGEKIATIAEQLNLSAKTINTYRYRIFDKFKLSSDVELVHFALKHKMFDVDTLE